MEVHSRSQIQSLQEQVRDAARLAREELNTLSTDPLEALHRLRFEKCGYHPLKGHELNLIEQLNQTFTVMASLAAALHLIKWFPQSGGLRLHLGTESGRDIESIRPNKMEKVEVEAEVFAAVHPNNNGKLKADVKRLAKSRAASRYVFFYAPSHSHSPGRQCSLEQLDSNVKVWALGRQEIM